MQEMQLMRVDNWFWRIVHHLCYSV